MAQQYNPTGAQIPTTQLRITTPIKEIATPIQARRVILKSKVYFLDYHERGGNKKCNYYGTKKCGR